MELLKYIFSEAWIELFLILLISIFCYHIFRQKYQNSFKYIIVFITIGCSCILIGSVIAIVGHGKDAMANNLLLKDYFPGEGVMFLSRQGIFAGYCFISMTILSVIEKMFSPKKTEKGVNEVEVVPRKNKWKR